MSTAYLQIQGRPSAGRTTAALCAGMALAKRLRLQQPVLWVDLDGHGSGNLDAFLSHLNKHHPIDYYRPKSWAGMVDKVKASVAVVLDGEGTAYEALRSHWSASAREARAQRGSSPLGDIPPQGWIEINEMWREWVASLAHKHVISTYRVEGTHVWSSIVRGEIVVGEQARGQYEAGMGADVRLSIEVDATGTRRLRLLSDKSWTLQVGRDIGGSPQEIYRRVAEYLGPHLRTVDSEPRSAGLVRFEGEVEWKETSRQAEKDEREAIMAFLELTQHGFPILCGMSAEAKKNRAMAWFGLLGVPEESAGLVSLANLRQAVKTIKSEGWEQSRLNGWKPIAALAELGKPKAEDRPRPVPVDDAPREVKRAQIIDGEE